MRPTPRASRGAVTSPHHLASQAGLSVLRDGGNAIEACIAAAATVAVVYPHMNSIGGDAFWLIGDDKGGVTGIDASGRGGEKVTAELYCESGHDAVPLRGPLAACTVAGTISGWSRALEVSKSWGGKLPLSRLLEDAIHYAKNGTPVADDLAEVTGNLDAELLAVPGFEQAFLRNGAGLSPAEPLVQTNLAGSLEQLARAGLQDFYTGDLAAALVKGFEKAGMPLSANDLAAHRPVDVAPLSLDLSVGTIYNMPPPSQGLAAMIVLGIYDRMIAAEGESYDHHHRLIEAVKRAFVIRNREIGDPGHLKNPPESFLTDASLDALAADIDPAKALEWNQARNDGDTIWLATMDGEGRGVSFIQSLYFGFGSGVVVPDTGIIWQNRGAGFSMNPNSVSAIAPGRKPFHTLSPAIARLKDGRLMLYGTRGADAQPQIQAQLFTHHVYHGMPLQETLDTPRWVQGRTQRVDDKFDLLVEDGFDPSVLDALVKAGHKVEIGEALNSTMGHAGAITRTPNGVMEGASDPRSDGTVATF